MSARTRGERRGVRLNWGVIAPVLAGVTLAVGVGMLVYAVVGAAYGDGAAAAFGISGAIALPLGLLGLRARTRLTTAPLRARDGYFAVTAAWVLAAALGAVPFLAAGTFTSPIDAFFESMSGFTGCGASVLADVEAEPHAILMWRSLMHFLGGVGIVLLIVAIAPATGLASQRLFFTESAAPITERLTPRIADTAKIIWGVYLTLTVLGISALLLAGMGGFDAVNHALSGVATGGFSTRTKSIGHFDSLAIELVTMGILLGSGVSMLFYWRLLKRKDARPQIAEVRAFLLIVAAATAVVTASLLAAGDADSFATALRISAFSVVSLITTTGFVTTDFDAFNDVARMVIVGATFIGACAGSTTGGMKVVRVMLLARTGLQEIQRQIQPQAVQVLRMPGKVFGEDVRRTVLGFFLLYVTVAVLGSLAMLVAGMDFLSAITSATSALTLGGAGLGDVGATENHTAVPPGGRVIMAALMLAGRLEVFTVVALLTPVFWRRQWA